jgi:hypothetical protein
MAYNTSIKTYFHLTALSIYIRADVTGLSTLYAKFTFAFSALRATYSTARIRCSILLIYMLYTGSYEFPQGFTEPNT